MKRPAIEPAEAADSPLGRSLLSRHVAMISVGGIIGAGLFVGSSASIAAVGPAIIVSFALAGLIVLMVMRMLGEMALALPGVNAFTEFARAGLGNWAGFTTGWLYWYFWVVVVAVEAIAGATLIQHWIDLPLWVIGWALLGVLTGSNLTSTRTYGETEFWFASLKVAAIVAFIVVAAAYVFGLTSGRGPDLSNLTAHGGFAPKGIVAILAGVTTVIFSLCGAEISTIAAAESPEPARTIARLTTSVIFRITLFYVGSLFLIVAIVPWTEIVPGQSPFVVAMERIKAPAAGAITNIIVLTAVLSCLNSGLYVASRILFTLAGRGDAPQWAVAINARKVPARAILISSSFGWAATLAAVVSRDGVFAFLVNASGATMLVIYLLSALAQIRLRREIERLDPGRLRFRMWLFPYASYATVAAIVGVLLAMALTPALASQFWISGLLAALVVGAYLLFRKTKKPATA